MLKPAAAIETLMQYHPPLGGRTGLRLDFNENTAGCSPRVLDRLRQLSAEDLTRYPERDRVESLVAQWLGIDAAQVLLTNGVDEGIHLLSETFLEPRCEALVVVPTFSMYQIYAAATGARVVTVQSDKDFQFPIQRVLDRITPATRLIAIANPNNPTGTVTPRETLLAIAEAAPEAAVLIDEAYYDFYGESVLGDIARLPNLFIARTFSKAYGMAGLRVGVLAGAAPHIAFVKKVASPYNVNAIALACLPEAIRDEEYVENYVAQVRRSRERLEAELEQLGLTCWKSSANFVLVRLGSSRETFMRRMRECGILVRDRNSDPGCAGCVRITVGTEEQTNVLISALRFIVGELRSAAEVSA
jgi:histidinol-phosphate aminotransferase